MQYHLLIVLLALASLAGQDQRLQSQGLGTVDAGGVRTVADDDGDLRLEAAKADVFRDGQKVGAASGEKDAESFHGLLEYIAVSGV